MGAPLELIHVSNLTLPVRVFQRGGCGFLHLRDSGHSSKPQHTTNVGSIYNADKVEASCKAFGPADKSVNEQRLLTEAECVGLKVGDITGLLNTRHNAFRHLDYILGFEKGNEQRKKNPES